MQIYSHFPIYTGNQIYKNKKQEKNQTSSLSCGKNNFALPNNYAIIFKSSIVMSTPVKRGINRFKTVFPPPVEVLKVRILPDFEGFIKANKRVLTAVIDEALDLEQWPIHNERNESYERKEVKKFIMCKAGMPYEDEDCKKYFPITDTMEYIVKELRLNDGTWGDFTKITERLLKEQRALVAERKADLKNIFPYENFDEISISSDEAKNGKISKILTVGQLLKKIFQKPESVESIIEKAIYDFENARYCENSKDRNNRNKIYNLNNDDETQIQILKYMFSPKDKKFLSDKQIAKKLEFFDDEFNEFNELKKEALHRIVSIIKGEKKSTFPSSHSDNRPIITKRITEILEKRNIGIEKLLFLVNSEIKEKSKQYKYSTFKDGIYNNTLPDYVLEIMAEKLDVKFTELKGWALASKYFDPRKNSIDDLNDAIKAMKCAIKAKEKNEGIKLTVLPKLNKLKDSGDISLRTLLREMGYSGWGSIHKILSGERDIPDDKVPQIAKIVGIPEDQIMVWKISDNYPVKSINIALKELQNLPISEAQTEDWKIADKYSGHINTALKIS